MVKIHDHQVMENCKRNMKIEFFIHWKDKSEEDIFGEKAQNICQFNKQIEKIIKQPQRGHRFHIMGCIVRPPI